MRILLDGRLNAVENNDIAQNIFTGEMFDGAIANTNGVGNTVRLNRVSGVTGTASRCGAAVTTRL